VARELLSAPAMRGFSCAASAFLLLGGPSLAHAEAGRPPPECAAATAPSSGQRVPSNAPALVALDRSDPGATATFAGATLEPTSTATFTLRADPRLGGATLVVPSAPLADRTSYSLTVDVDCSTGRKAPLVTSFFTTDATPLPTESGSATARPSGLNDGITYVDIVPTPELEAYLAVTMFEVAVGGDAWGTLPYDGIRREQGGVRRIWMSGARVGGSTAFRSLCEPGDDRIKTEAVEVRPHVAGAARDPEPIRVDVPIDCTKNAALPDGDGPGDAGVDGAGAGGGGCACMSSSRAPISPGFGPLLAAFGVAAALRRSAARRRPRPTPAWR
jgi:hypothetical protein